MTDYSNKLLFIRLIDTVTLEIAIPSVLNNTLAKSLKLIKYFKVNAAAIINVAININDTLPYTEAAPGSRLLPNKLKRFVCC